MQDVMSNDRAKQGVYVVKCSVSMAMLSTTFKL